MNCNLGKYYNTSNIQQVIDFINEINNFITQSLNKIYDNQLLTINKCVPVYLEERRELINQTITTNISNLRKQIIDVEELLSAKKKKLEQLQDIYINNENPLFSQLKNYRNELENEIENLDNKKTNLLDILKPHENEPDNISITTIVSYELLGCYRHNGIHHKGPEIALMMETLKSHDGTWDIYKVAATYIHECFHAYYDKIPDCEIDKQTANTCFDKKPFYDYIEEPLTEYAMLCFVQEFISKHPGHKNFLDQALKDVHQKQYYPGCCFYGFGYYLYSYADNFAPIANWISLFHDICHNIPNKSNEKDEYDAQFASGCYPHNNQEHYMALLYVILKTAENSSSFRIPTIKKIKQKLSNPDIDLDNALAEINTYIPTLNSLFPIISNLHNLNVYTLKDIADIELGNSINGITPSDIIDSGKNYIPCLISNKPIVKLGDIVMSATGNACIWQGLPSNCGKHVYKITLNDPNIINKYYLMYYLRSISSNILKRKKSTLPLISKIDLLNTQIIIPCIAEQNAISDFYQSIERINYLSKNVLDNFLEGFFIYSPSI